MHLHHAGKLYRSSVGDVDSVEERHRHRYEVNPACVEELEKAGLKFVGHSTDNTRMEMLELTGKNTIITYEMVERVVL